MALRLLLEAVPNLNTSVEAKAPEGEATGQTRSSDISEMLVRVQ